MSTLPTRFALIIVAFSGLFRQRTWRHAIPKVAQAGPRIALMFRPAWSDDY